MDRPRRKAGALVLVGRPGSLREPVRVQSRRPTPQAPFRFWGTGRARTPRCGAPPRPRPTACPGPGGGRGLSTWDRHGGPRFVEIGVQIYAPHSRFTSGCSRPILKRRPLAWTAVPGVGGNWRTEPSSDVAAMHPQRRLGQSQDMITSKHPAPYRCVPEMNM